MNYILSVLLLALSVNSMYAQEVINVYGLGGPHATLIESGELFKEQTGITVNITFGSQVTRQDEALKNADILYSASDNQIVAFLKTHRKNFTQENVSLLYLHKSIILVQKGNPVFNYEWCKNCLNDGAGVSQTSSTGVWEDIVGRLNNVLKIWQNFENKLLHLFPTVVWEEQNSQIHKILLMFGLLGKIRLFLMI
ncbi:Bacterial extracellular solute-binding protein [Brevinema andersonii]|uniref:Bacterial extracellular solute-binding protein n=1 Tax=Brevinema andersonii TaxID=34097 RepID=A0A1I1CYE4_BREAD|nr:Bacterial extracellular solute-binding protein [Brevinema andersonii]